MGDRSGRFGSPSTICVRTSLSGRDRRRVEKHLGACEGCTSYLHQMRETVRLTGKLTEDEVPAPVRRELIAAFRDWRAS